MQLADPYFAVTVPFDVTDAYTYSKENDISFFGKYLHDCMKAINSTENMRLRILNNEVVEYDTIHASATIMRPNKTFAFSFINFDENLEVFLGNLNKEKERIMSTDDLYPPVNGLDCIHCSALPWSNFSGHKEPVSGKLESVPKLAFGKIERNVDKRLIMNVGISANHALADGYHIGLFTEAFQENLNRKL